MALHSWQLTPKQAIALQKQFRSKLKVKPLEFFKIKNVLAVDASYLLKENKVLAVAAVFTYPELKPVAYESVLAKVKFPYIPGLLSFREGPAVLKAIAKLSASYDAVLVDGQGFAHPRRFGLASHLGLWLNRPTVGVGKTVLVGHYQEPAAAKGSQAPLLDNNEVIGVVLRTQTNVKPIFVSVGHLVDLSSAVQLCLNCTTKYRLPEPLRQVDLLTKKLRKEKAQK
jgi:deoxyribonuclease V